MNSTLVRLCAVALVLVLTTVGCSSTDEGEATVSDSAGSGSATAGAQSADTGGTSSSTRGGSPGSAAAGASNQTTGGTPNGAAAGSPNLANGGVASGATGGSTNTSGGSTNASGGSTSGAEGGAVSSSGGLPSTSGGAPPQSAGACARAIGVCATPQVKVTDVDLGAPIARYGREGDTEPLPLAIAAMPSGGSRVAALGTDGNVRIAELDCEDKLVGTPFSIPAIDLQDIHADNEGGVVLVTRNATNAGTDNCGNGKLCGGESSPCRTMWMVRFNSAGAIEWETQVTNLSDQLAGYDNGARFIWWYQHHGRLAFDGSNYAAYFGAAITVNGANACIDIHQGDRMQVVKADGTPVPRHPDSFEVGCSHAWQSRIVWDPRTKKFAMVCTTDNDCRIAQPNPYRTVAKGDCDGTLFGGDLVLASTPGYWTAWSQGGQIRLEHFSTGASDKTVMDAGPSEHPHLVSYGADKMLLSWETGTAITAQIRDAGSGEAIGAEFRIDVPDHDFQAFKDYPDGSVAYPASGASPSQLRVARVMACQ